MVTDVYISVFAVIVPILLCHFSFSKGERVGQRSADALPAG